MNDQNKIETLEDRTKRANILWIIGICFMGAGGALIASVGPVGYGLFVLGLFFFIMGMAKRKKLEDSEKE